MKRGAARFAGYLSLAFLVGGCDVTPRTFLEAIPVEASATPLVLSVVNGAGTPLRLDLGGTTSNPSMALAPGERLDVTFGFRRQSDNTLEVSNPSPPVILQGGGLSYEVRFRHPPTGLRLARLDFDRCLRADKEGTLKQGDSVGLVTLPPSPGDATDTVVLCVHNAEGPLPRPVY